MDVTAAFDSVWHGGLLFKLIDMKINPTMVRLIQSYLEGRTFHVRHGEAKSTIRRIEAGVPQGSLLGPDLYLLFTADIPRESGTRLSIYADDTAVFASSRNEKIMFDSLQRAVDGLMDWASKWRLRINHEKCVAVRFTRKRCPPP